jgi:hypothetical protein
MKKELDRAMKKLEANLPEGILISLEYVRNRFSSGNKNETYRVYIAGTDSTNYVFSIYTKTAMEAVDDALVKFSQQLEESANARQTN